MDSATVRTIRWAVFLWAAFVLGSSLLAYGMNLANGLPTNLPAYLYNAAVIFGGLAIMIGSFVHFVNCVTKPED